MPLLLNFLVRISEFDTLYTVLFKDLKEISQEFDLTWHRRVYFRNSCETLLLAQSWSLGVTAKSRVFRPPVSG